MRRELRRVRSGQEASLFGHVSELEAQLAAAHEQLAQLETRTVQLDEQIASTLIEFERLREVERTLGKVYAGGWWRLRRRLLPLMRLVGRAR